MSMQLVLSKASCSYTKDVEWLGVQSNLDYPNPFGHVEKLSLDKQKVGITFTTPKPHPQIRSLMQKIFTRHRLIVYFDDFNLILVDRILTLCFFSFFLLSRGPHTKQKKNCPEISTQLSWMPRPIQCKQAACTLNRVKVVNVICAHA